MVLFKLSVQFQRKAYRNLRLSDVIDFIVNWQPDLDRGSFLEERSYEGLGQEIANIIYENTSSYKTSISAIAKTNPTIANEIIKTFEKSESISSGQWETILDLCENLLSDDKIRTSMQGGYEATWNWVRNSIARLIKSGFTKDGHFIPENLWPKARNILLILIDDPDPETEPKPEFDKDFSINDPLTVALNRTRPIAVSALIAYALFRANWVEKGDRLEGKVEQALTRKLDVIQESSLSVRSVFGTYLPWLHGLDSEWVEKNIDIIFPKIVDLESLWYFQAAWDAYILDLLHKW